MRDLFVRALASAAVACLAWALSLPAQVPPAGAELVVRVEGEPTAAGRLQLTLAFGSSVKDGVLLVSEPSHTPIATVISPDFAASAGGRAVREQVLAADGGVVISELPAAQPRLVVAARPEADERVVVIVLEGAARQTVADANVGSGAFAFATFVQGESTLHCCENPPCPYRCIACGGPAFTCCGPPDCEIVCHDINCDV